MDNGSRWAHYPALVEALHQRDWSTLAHLYQDGAPAGALFPETVGSQDLMLPCRPRDGRLSLPIALMVGHAFFQQNPAHAQTLRGEAFGEDDERELAAIQAVFVAWQAAGGPWDEPGVAGETHSEDDPLSNRSLTAHAAMRMTPLGRDGFSFVDFSADVEPWLERFLEWGWSPTLFERAPLVHRAVRCAQMMFAQTLMDQAGENARLVDALDNTPLHAVGRTLADDGSPDDLQAWLDEQPTAAWAVENAEGHTPFEDWLIEGAWTAAGLALASPQSLALRLKDEVRDEAMATHGERAQLMTLMGQWERAHLQHTADGVMGDSPAPARTPRRL